jgi:hypothetical protein
VTPALAAVSLKSCLLVAADDHNDAHKREKEKYTAFPENNKQKHCKALFTLYFLIRAPRPVNISPEGNEWPVRDPAACIMMRRDHSQGHKYEAAFFAGKWLLRQRNNINRHIKTSDELHRAPVSPAIGSALINPAGNQRLLMEPLHFLRDVYPSSETVSSKATGGNR